MRTSFIGSMSSSCTCPRFGSEPRILPLSWIIFLGIFAARYKRDKRSVSRDALRRLAGYSWPGNVRELEHVLLNAGCSPTNPFSSRKTSTFPTGSRSAPVSTRDPENTCPRIGSKKALLRRGDRKRRRTTRHLVRARCARLRRGTATTNAIGFSMLFAPATGTEFRRRS